MKKPLIFTLFLSFFMSAHVLFAQNPLVKMWDKNYGGLEDDEPTCFQETRDGGFILGGFTFSDIGGDKTVPLRNAVGITDFWVLKIDSAGNKEWERDFGGTNGDQLNSIQQTFDGGYILGGMSASNTGADKTQASYGNFDYWIIRLDAQGNKLWDKDFGGISSDQLISIMQTSDGGFILGGNSVSGISGSKTEACRGATDFWIVKIDSLGNQVWDKTFGGSDADKLYTVRQSRDGGFILGGSSWSPASGDKTAATFGGEDFWVVKTDAAGNKLWDKDFGGIESDILFSLVQSYDDGYVLAGRSGSGISGNKTQPLRGGYDFWLVKIDSLGNAEWDKNIGGTGNEDEFGNISLTEEKGFLIAGTSYSSVGGDKTENNLGQEQSWFIKLDSLFNIEWDKTVLTPCHDEIGFAVQTKGQCYAVLNANSGTGGIGGERSQPAWNNSHDYWIIKYCDSTWFPPIASAGLMQDLCPGTCTSFQSLSTNTTSWQWDFPGATPDTSTQENPGIICYGAPGSYDVILIASNAHRTDTLFLPGYVNVLPYPAPQGIMQSGDTLFANAGATSYQWYFNGNIITGATDYFYFAPLNGDYNLIATDANGCEVEAAIFGIITGTDKVVTSKYFSLYPNPATDKVEFVVNNFSVNKSSACKIRIIDMLGAEVYSDDIKTDFSLSFDVSILPAGIYTVVLDTGDLHWQTRLMKK